MPPTELAERFYAALQDRDVTALEAVLDPDVRAEITAGLPGGFGGSYTGAASCIRDLWGRVDRSFAIAPYPEEYLTTVDGGIVVTGTYRGTARATGRSVEAAFAHVLTFGDAGIRSIHQITDSSRWAAALAEEPPAPAVA